MTKKSTCPSSTVIGYLRVSTADQNIEKNKADILRLANHHDLGKVRFVEEKISGKVSWRERKVAKVLESLRANDAIVVSELSRVIMDADDLVQGLKKHWLLRSAFKKKPAPKEPPPPARSPKEKSGH